MATMHKVYATSSEYPGKERTTARTMQVKVSHQRSPCALKFEDRSQEKQERCARGDAWRLAKKILLLKETSKATSFSPTNDWCFPAPSAVKPEERECVVDSGASLHMLSKNDLNSAELETERVSTTVVTLNGDVLTKEDATVYVKELDFFVTVMLLEDTPAVLSLGKFAKITDIPTSGPVVRNHNSSRWQTNAMQHGEQRTHRCSGFVGWLPKLSFSYNSRVTTAGGCSSYIASSVNTK